MLPGDGLVWKSRDFFPFICVFVQIWLPYQCPNTRETQTIVRLTHTIVPIGSYGFFFRREKNNAYICLFLRVRELRARKSLPGVAMLFFFFFFSLSSCLRSSCQMCPNYFSYFCPNPIHLSLPVTPWIRYIPSPLRTRAIATPSSFSSLLFCHRLFLFITCNSFRYSNSNCNFKLKEPIYAGIITDAIFSPWSWRTLFPFAVLAILYSIRIRRCIISICMYIAAQNTRIHTFFFASVRTASLNKYKWKGLRHFMYIDAFISLSPDSILHVDACTDYLTLVHTHTLPISSIEFISFEGTAGSKNLIKPDRILRRGDKVGYHPDIIHAATLLNHF